MRSMRIFLGLLVVIFIFGEVLNAASLDGTSSLKYQGTHYVLRDTDTVTGFVRFANGFSIVPATNHASSAILDTCISCSGGFDLQTTGTLKLIGDLILDSVTTLTSSGKIYGYNRALLLNGDLTLAANQVLHLGGNLVIDGLGHDIFINEHAQILLDNYATVTIKNATIHNRRNDQAWPALAITTSLARLTLSDVELALDSDLYINKGRLFINNDVAVTGTSSFVWHSTAPCTIEPNSCLYFDQGTTFSYAPPSTNKDLIRLTDKSSVVQLDNCSLLTTHTGLRLTKGYLCLDDKILLNSSAVNKLNAVTTSTWLNYGNENSAVYSVAWSPDGRYVSIGGFKPYLANDFQIYRYTMDTLVTVTLLNYGPEDCYVYANTWSPDGKYIALGGFKPYGGKELQVYTFANNELTLVASQDYGTGSAAIHSLCWSPDARYLAIGGAYPSLFNGAASSNELQIYKFNGKALIAVTSQDYGDEIDTVAWSPDGQYLAVGGTIPTKFGADTKHDELQIYKFTMDTLVTVTSQDFGASTATGIRSIAWSPDGQYLAIGGYYPQLFGGVDNTDECQIYRFDGSSLTAVTSQSYGVVTAICNSVSWSTDGRYLAIGGYAPVSGHGGFDDANYLRIYSFNGSSLTPITSHSSWYQLNAISWAWDNKYVALGGRMLDRGTNELWIERCQYLNETATQAMTNGIVFGDSAKGATYDLDVAILSGANVEIKGKVFDDSI